MRIREKICHFHFNTRTREKGKFFWVKKIRKKQLLSETVREGKGRETGNGSERKSKGKVRIYIETDKKDCLGYRI